MYIHHFMTSAIHIDPLPFIKNEKIPLFDASNLTLLSRLAIEKRDGYHLLKNPDGSLLNSEQPIFYDELGEDSLISLYAEKVKDGLIQGEGYLLYSEDGVAFSYSYGHYQEGKLEGEGAKWDYSFDKEENTYSINHILSGPYHEGECLSGPVLEVNKGRYIYKGEFLNGKPEGQGEIHFDILGGIYNASGYHYVGEFKDGEREGQGVLTYFQDQSDYRFEGLFAKGNPLKGDLYKDEDFIYEGEVNENVEIYGKGTYHGEFDIYASFDGDSSRFLDGPVVYERRVGRCQHILKGESISSNRDGIWESSYSILSYSNETLYTSDSIRIIYEKGQVKGMEFSSDSKTEEEERRKRLLSLKEKKGYIYIPKK
ncbi:MAG: hypothetical protein K5694_05460 [Bacilli bacterium]|nr:hypothetical protein [Bacilli bacterium]